MEVDDSIKQQYFDIMCCMVEEQKRETAKSLAEQRQAAVKVSADHGRAATNPIHDLRVCVPTEDRLLKCFPTSVGEASAWGLEFHGNSAASNLSIATSTRCSMECSNGNVGLFPSTATPETSMTTNSSAAAISNTGYLASPEKSNAAHNLFDGTPHRHKSSLGCTLSIMVCSALYPVSDDLLHPILAPYGVKWLVVNPKATTTTGSQYVKAIVELNSKDAAARARVALQGKYLFDECGYLNVMFALPYEYKMATIAAAAAAAFTTGLEASVMREGIPHIEVTAEAVNTKADPCEDIILTTELLAKGSTADLNFGYCAQQIIEAPSSMDDTLQMAPAPAAVSVSNMELTWVSTASCSTLYSGGVEASMGINNSNSDQSIIVNAQSVGLSIVTVPQNMKPTANSPTAGLLGTGLVPVATFQNGGNIFLQPVSCIFNRLSISFYDPSLIYSVTAVVLRSWILVVKCDEAVLWPNFQSPTGTTYLLLPWDPGDSKIGLWHMRILLQLVTSYEFWDLPWDNGHQLIDGHKGLASVDFAAALYTHDVMDNCLKQLQFQNNSWATYLQFGRLQDVMGALIEMKPRPFRLFDLKYVDGRNLFRQPFSAHVQWQLAWSCEFLKLAAAISTTAKVSLMPTDAALQAAHSCIIFSTTLAAISKHDCTDLISATRSQALAAVTWYSYLFLEEASTTKELKPWPSWKMSLQINSPMRD